jgi:glycosyltransferase involved in cell wall biosynthesis
MGENKYFHRLCLIPEVKGVGGTVSFRQKLSNGLAERGIAVTNDLSDTPYDAVLVIGGTRDLLGLRHARQIGVPVVQRLDGMNWIHRKKSTGLKHYLRSEYGNFILSTIRSHLSNRLIYQSEFSRQWWEKEHGETNIPWKVIHNGVDLNRYSPVGNSEIPDDCNRILLVEGTLGGGYELGLQIAVQLCERLKSMFQREIELVVVGRVSPDLQEYWIAKTEITVSFTGQVPAEVIPEIDRSSHVLYAADLNPACPNSVIEALACGLPVAAFDTGAIPEIITATSGAVVPYGGDPWMLDTPDIERLSIGVNKILDNQTDYRLGARQRAEDAFGLDKMVEGYLEAIFG